MTRTEDYLRLVEHEIRITKGFSKATCKAFAELPVESRIVYARAIAFVGCDLTTVPVGITAAASPADRIRAARLMLLKLGLDSSDPRWSSLALDRLLEAVMGTPGGSVNDLLHALHGLLGEYSCDLTEPVRNIIKDFVVQCFTQYRASYEAADLRWLVEKTVAATTSAQAYLALHAVPPDIMRPRCAVLILKALASTPYWKEALDTLDDDLNNQEARSMLAEWLREGIHLSCAEDIQRRLV
jgi:hypothetical protein